MRAQNYKRVMDRIKERLHVQFCTAFMHCVFALRFCTAFLHCIFTEFCTAFLRCVFNIPQL